LSASSSENIPSDGDSTAADATAGDAAGGAHVADALAGLRRAIEQFDGCTEAEKAELVKEIAELVAMDRKLREGRVEIVIFGEIDTGKSALINALVGENVAPVDVRGGWTKETWSAHWKTTGVAAAGFEHSQILLIDTPGINEVAGDERAALAREAASRADLILFVTDSDLNQMEYAALRELAACHKPIVLVFNKIDNYTREERAILRAAFADSLRGAVASDDIVETAAHPLPREYVIEAADGSTRVEFRELPPVVEDLKLRILDLLAREGKALLALNAAMYAADRSDRIATVKMRLRDERANAVVWSFAVMKAIGVGITLYPVVDVIGASAVDITMVVTLAHVYGISLTKTNAQQLVLSIVKAAGWVMLSEVATNVAVSIFKGLTLGASHALTALPQAGAAGYGSIIVGQAAKYYFEHGASWGGEAPKSVVARILAANDKRRVIQRLQEEIRKKIRLNRHAAKP
jgi:small GTP-binding protein